MLFGTELFCISLNNFQLFWEAGKLSGKSLTLPSLAFNLCKVKSGRVNKNKMELTLLPKRKEHFTPYFFLRVFPEKCGVCESFLCPFDMHVNLFEDGVSLLPALEPRTVFLKGLGAISLKRTHQGRQRPHISLSSWDFSLSTLL